MVSVRLGDDEIAELRAAAARSGLRLSGYIAEASLAVARNTRPPMHDPIRDALAVTSSASTQLARVGTNLNQAVRALNTTGTAPAWLADAAARTLEAVRHVEAACDVIVRQLDHRRRARRQPPPRSNE